ncbi:MAG: sensor histidine kinase [Gammaproteobacteria bacterium]
MRDRDRFHSDQDNKYQAPETLVKGFELSETDSDISSLIPEEMSSSGIDASNVISIIEAKHEWEHSVDSLKKLAIFILDKQLNIVRTNKTIELWGLGDVNTVKGKHIADIIDPLISNDSSESFYRTWVNLDGKLTMEWQSEFCSLGKILRFTFYPSMDVENTLRFRDKCFYILLVDDISNRIKVENKLKDYVTELKLQKAIDDQKLIHINKMLEMNLRYEKRSKEKIKESEQRLKKLSEQLVNAQEEERKRVACDLHDGVGQILSLLKYQVEAIIADEDTGDCHLFNDIHKNLGTALQEVKRVSMNLRPKMLDSKGVLATLVWFLEEYQKVYKSEVRYLININEELITDTIKIALFRIVQEALNNTAKHANASHVTVTLKEVKGNILLRIIDDGNGINCIEDKLDDPEGLGLKNMIERAEQTNAKLTIQSEPSGGTIVQVLWKNETEVDD